MLLRSLLFLILVSSCSTRSLLTGKYPIKEKNKITSVEFISQEKYQCGPASLAMMFSHLGEDIDEKQFASMVFTPDKHGSFQSDMISAVRRQKFLPLPINNLKNLLTEVDAGNPVLILQNLGLKWFPVWHYAVVVGYDLNKSEMIIHSGTDAYSRLGFYTFNKTWDRSENWGLLVVRPGTVPVSTTEVQLVSGIAQLEAMSYFEEAEKGYESVLKKFPASLGALIGLGNVHFERDRFSESVKFLKKATTVDPHSAQAWHNLALALKANNDMLPAKKAAHKAVNLCGQAFLPIYTQNLKDLL